VRDAQSWLAGADVAEPHAVVLGHAVDAYARLGPPERAFHWMEDKLNQLREASAAEWRTQDLLDLLFLVCRHDRFCDGFLDGCQREVVSVMAEIRDRRDKSKSTDLSQEDLLRAPVFIPPRPLKDPRAILMLDPACGSMHFGLYAFDLFEVIYDEAWEMAARMKDEGRSMKEMESAYPEFSSFILHTSSFSSKEEFLRQVPRLIIEHNLHGIDIDPRCAQIAGLSLWLRAQKAWQRLGLKPAERPAIKRSNIVCAEPMPGEKELLREFVEREFPAAERTVCLRLLEAIFDKMQLAGEAGSLLKIEEEIRSAIEDARTAWDALQSRPRELFSTDELNKASRQLELTALEQAVQSTIHNQRSTIAEGFWERIEERIYAALRDYAEQAENGGGFQRRLFAEDAARGFAFIDVCRKRYDVVVMNPPFGEVPTSIDGYNNGCYPPWADNILCTFIARAWQMCDSVGAVGAIFDRSAVIKSSYEDFRRTVLLASNRISSLADVGWEVLDANVETTCLTLARLPENQTSLFFDVRLQSVDEKATALKNMLDASNDGMLYEGASIAHPILFRHLPNAVLGYDFPDFLKRAFATFDGLGKSGYAAFQGHALEAEVHYRAWWELPLPRTHTQLSDWTFAVKGGDYSPFFLVACDVAYYGRRGSRVPNSTANVLRNLDYQQLPGVAWGKRGEFTDAQPLPRGTIFTHEGHAIPNINEHDAWFILAVLNTAFFSVTMNTFCGQHKFSGYVNLFPLASFSATERARLGELAKAIHDEKARWYQGEERNPQFGTVYARGHLAANCDSLSGFLNSTLSALNGADELITEKEREIENAIREAYQPTSTEMEWIARRCNSRPDDVVWYDRKGISPKDALSELALSYVSYWMGITFGRWNIRYATGEQAAPELPDPFAPLPVCPPGQLQNAQGLPARPEDVPAAYPVTNIPWDGILVDDPNHPLDIERRVREVIEIIWGAKERSTPHPGPLPGRGGEGGATAEAIEHEACEILGVKTLRDYFRKSFFADHLKRYSKSRRQAPIYWPLSTASGSYTVWLYYHRFAKDTLYRVQELANDKLAFEERQLTNLRQESGPNPSAGQRKQLAEKEAFVQELREFRTEIARVAPLWNPDLNDGVIINFAPLWRLIAHRPWQKAVKECWDALVAGDYDWAHLALHLWPERVVPKCQTDRSLAIAHSLDAVFWEEDDKGKWHAKKVLKAELDRLIAERTSPAVKDALKSLVEAPVAGGGKKRKRE
jgi:hypothetical protein